MNSLNLNRLDGGDVIKQGDFGTRLEFELLDEHKEAITELDGQECLVALGFEDEIVWHTRKTVVSSKVAFNVDKILPIGKLDLEITVGDWVFPSDKKQKIKVVKSLKNYKEVEFQALPDQTDFKSDIAELKDWLEDKLDSGSTAAGKSEPDLPDLLTFYNIAKI